MSDRERAKELKKRIMDLQRKHQLAFLEEAEPYEKEMLEIMNRNAPRYYYIGGELITKHVWDD